MALLPAIKRFLTEDFPEQKDWIGKLFYPLNLILTTLSSALSNGITLGENVFSQVTTQSVTGASPTVSFLYKFSPRIPIGVTIFSIVQSNTAAVVVAATSCTWTISSGMIMVSVQGLDAAGVYNITFTVWGG